MCGTWDFLGICFIIWIIVLLQDYYMISLSLYTVFCTVKKMYIKLLGSLFFLHVTIEFPL